LAPTIAAALAEVDVAGADAIARAARQAVVFRQIFPPSVEAAPLGFFGGAPVAPPEFVWPRGADGAALSFVMQIDCADVPERGRLGLLPDSGVLYVFTDLEWGGWSCRVLHADRPDASWRPLAPPADLKPVYGASEGRYAAPWAGPDVAELPRLLPKWPFRPVVVDVVAEEMDEFDDRPNPLMWPGDVAVAEALLAVEDAVEPAPRFDIRAFMADDGTLVRPFLDYPHDWRAVQILAAAVADRAARAGRYDTWLYRDLPKDERAALLAGLVASAGAWKAAAAAEAPFDAVPQADRDRLWSWVEDHAALVRFCLEDAVTQAIEASLTASPEAAARVPPEAAARIRFRHLLAQRSGDGIFAPTPDRMLAAPSYVQGNQTETATTHLLLLELSSNAGLGHRFGDGVYQFWITPDDLRARRFDRVQVTGDAY
jgi:hypothetical protein